MDFIFLPVGFIRVAPRKGSNSPYNRRRWAPGRKLSDIVPRFLGKKEKDDAHKLPWGHIRGQKVRETPPPRRAKFA